MSEGNITAAPVPLMLADGTELLFSPLRDRDIVELDEWVRAQYIKNAVAALPEDVTQEESDRVRDVAVRASFGISWLRPPGSAIIGTVTGMARLAWTCVRRNHPELTFNDLLNRMYDPKNIFAVDDAFNRANHVPKTTGQAVQPLKKQKRSSRKSKRTSS